MKQDNLNDYVQLSKLKLINNISKTKSVPKRSREVLINYIKTGVKPHHINEVNDSRVLTRTMKKLRELTEIYRLLKEIEEIK
jgi:hypothetical protein